MNKEAEIEELKRRLWVDMSKIAFFFYQTYGFPFELFKEILEEARPFNLGTVVLNFRHSHPGYLEDWKQLDKCQEASKIGIVR